MPELPKTGLTYICSFNVVHLRCWEYYSTFVEKNKRSGCLLLFCIFKNAVLALQILCMMGMWLDWRKLAYAWTDGWASSAFLCSFVLMSLFIEHTDYAGMRSLVLARDDGAQALCKMASCKVKREAGFTR